MEKIYMIDEVENVKEFDTLEDAREFVNEAEPVIVNYAAFYRAPANLHISTEIAAEGQLLGYGYQILD